MAIRANSRRLGRAEIAPLSMAVKGRPEQGNGGPAVHYGPCSSDTGCGTRGTDQRAVSRAINGAGNQAGQSVHWCSQE